MNVLDVRTRGYKWVCEGCATGEQRQGHSQSMLHCSTLSCSEMQMLPLKKHWHHDCNIGHFTLSSNPVTRAKAFFEAIICTRMYSLSNPFQQNVTTWLFFSTPIWLWWFKTQCGYLAHHAPLVSVLWQSNCLCWITQFAPMEWELVIIQFHIDLVRCQKKVKCWLSPMLLDVYPTRVWKGQV